MREDVYYDSLMFVNCAVNIHMLFGDDVCNYRYVQYHITISPNSSAAVHVAV